MSQGSSCDRLFAAIHEAIDREARRSKSAGLPAGPFFLGVLHALVRQTANVAAKMVTPADQNKEERQTREKRLHDTICEAVDQEMRCEWKDAHGSKSGQWLPQHGGHA